MSSSSVAKSNSDPLVVVMSGNVLGSDAYQVALQHGAKDEDILALRTRDALLEILQETNIEADICEDVADACEINDLDALAIASGLLSVDEVAESCFLTKDEAEVNPFLVPVAFVLVAGACHMSVPSGSDVRGMEALST